MRINSLEVKNFKSIEHTEIKFNDLNILIGQNASGKSNFLELFQFIKDIGKHGLEDAIHLRGGVEYFRNTIIKDSQNFKLNCDFSKPRPSRRGGTVENNDAEFTISDIYTTDYQLEISFSQNDFEVANETVVNHRHISKADDDSKKFTLIESTSRSDTHEINSNRHVDDNSIEFDFDDYYSWIDRRSGIELSPKESLLGLSLNPTGHFIEGLRGLQNLGIYDIEPEKIKEGTKLKGKRQLEPNGSNLPLVLKEIVKSSDDKETFLNILGEVLPFIQDWETDTLRDKSIDLKIQEEYEQSEDQYLPANLISDGTINVIALIIILYFERGEIIMIEEPERNIHPSLIANVVEMMKNVSKNQDKQIFSTTHNVEFIKNVDLDNILLVNRNQEGFTEISKPEENERIKDFLESGMGLEELYVNNILEDEL